MVVRLELVLRVLEPRLVSAPALVVVAEECYAGTKQKSLREQAEQQEMKWLE